MANNIVTATFNASHFAVTPSIYRYNYGNILTFEGIENLPEYFEVHFANRGDTTTTPWLGQDGQVEIPNDYLQTGKQIVAYIYLHETAADGETVYKVLIPVRDREEPEDVQPTPEQQTAIEAAIYALNAETGVATEAAAAAEESAQRAEEAAESAEESANAASDSATVASNAASSASESATQAQNIVDGAIDDINTAKTAAVQAVRTEGETQTANAKGQADRADASAAAAASSASQAETSATNAGNSATAAAQSASNAATAANNANTKAGEAAQSAASAASSVATATQKASEASASATAAAGSATNAGSAASAAAASATAAGNAQTAAETAQDKAEDAQEAAETAQSAAETAAASVAGSAAQIAQNTEDIVDLKSAINELENELGLAAEYFLPEGYEAAAYENQAKTRAFKYDNNELVIYNKSTVVGQIAASEVTTTSAGIAIDDGIALDLNDVEQPILKFEYDNNVPTEGGPVLIIRLYNDAYNNHRPINYILPVGSGTVNADVKSLATDAGIDISAFHNCIIRGVGWVGHTSTEPERMAVHIMGFYEMSGAITQRVADIENELTNLSKKTIDASTSTIANPFRSKPYYAHLFINTVSDAEEITYVPSQSLYDIQISKRLGFDVIEANTHILSDGTSIVLHGVNNTFGPEFNAAAGSVYTDADVQATQIATVDLAWVKANVRYKAKYPKLRVAPPTLEEFLYECRKYSMIPLINYKAIEQVAIADAIMGKDNYIMYGATSAVRNISNCMINTWSNFTTKAAILEWVKQIGNPCMVGTTHYDNFTPAEWTDITNEVHKMGGLMAFASAYLTTSQSQDLIDAGFDVGGSGWVLNPVDSGNLVNISADNGFDEFDTTGVYADGQVTLPVNGTIVPKNQQSAHFLTGQWLEVTFIGTISVAMGRFITHANSVMSASESKTVKFSTYGLNIAPTFEIKANAANTIVENIVYKASVL